MALLEQRYAVKTIFLGFYPQLTSPRVRRTPAEDSIPSETLANSGERNVSDKAKKNPGIMLAIFAAAAGWQIYDLATATEAPSRAVLTLQYVLLAGLFLGIAGALFNLLRSQ